VAATHDVPEPADDDAQRRTAIRACTIQEEHHMHVKIRRPSAGTVLGTVALVFALTGAAVALPGSNSVNSGDIKNGQVKTKDLSKKAVAPKVKVQSATAGAQNIGANSEIIAVSKSVPAGRYAISAKTVLFMNGDDSFSCRIYVGDNEVDEARINPATDAAQTQTVSLLGVANVPGGTPIEVECSAASELGQVDVNQLVAIPVK
jgi:hypothetical protein